MKRWMLRILLCVTLGAIVNVVVAWGFAMWGDFRGYTDESLAILQKNKMTIVKPSPQLMGDMKKIGDEMLSDWLKQAGTDGKEIVDAYRKK